MGYMQTSFTWSILFFTNVCKKINCFKVFRLPGAWTWDTKGWHTILWAYIKFLELAWSSMSFHAVPWACMQFHDLVCSCRLRLSSSQEFRSACFRRKFASRHPGCSNLTCVMGADGLPYTTTIQKISSNEHKTLMRSFSQTKSVFG